MDNIYLTVFRTIAPAIISILKAESKKSENTIDDKLVNVLENILKEFKLL